MINETVVKLATEVAEDFLRSKSAKELSEVNQDEINLKIDEIVLQLDDKANEIIATRVSEVLSRNNLSDNDNWWS